MVIALGRVFDSNKRNVSIAGLLKAEPDLEKVEKKDGINRKNDRVKIDKRAIAKVMSSCGGRISSTGH